MLIYSKSFPLIKALSIGARIFSVVVTGVLLHVTYKYIYKKIGSDPEDEFKNSDDYSDCYKVIRMKIPSYSKGGIIGKNGSTIRKIQEKTKTTIKFLNKNISSIENSDDKQSDWNFDVSVTNEGDQSPFEIILIRGLTLRVMEAEKEIKAIVASIPIYNEDSMMVDNRFVGKIIGKKGENVKRLKECYKVQIDIDRSESTQRKINIRGTTENIIECRRDIVKTIDLIIKENKYYISPNNELCRSTILAEDPVACSSNEKHSNYTLPKCQYVKYPGELNEKTFIYVSSVVDCSKFYAHIANGNMKELSNLSDELTEYFSSQVGDHSCLSLNIDDIVAGYYAASHTWQRVKIIGIKDDVFDVIFLDYGDSALLRATELRSFKNCPQFLDLPFQALRLVTYGIRPIHDSGWTDADIKAFENLTMVGHCHRITSILRRNGGQTMEVQLVDEATGIDIGQRLIDDGIALAKS